MNGSSSYSTSRSFSSSFAILMHVTEFYGVLQELGYEENQSYIDILCELISAEFLGTIEFCGLNEKGEAAAGAVIRIDWDEHELIVEAGDTVLLPVDLNEEPILNRIRFLARHFMNFFTSRQLKPATYFTYRDDLEEDAEELNLKYGLRTVEGPKRPDDTYDAPIYQSDYHPAVSLDHWFSK